jgi:hypothetical protein
LQAWRGFSGCVGTIAWAAVAGKKIPSPVSVVGRSVHASQSIQVRARLQVGMHLVFGKKYPSRESAFRLLLHAAGVQSCCTIRRKGKMMPARTKIKSQDEQNAERESREKPTGKPDGFENDPKDPANPNEVREQHLKKIKQ